MFTIFILFAFSLGFAAYRLGLPPLVGYLIAGFALNYLGYVPGEALETVSELGVTLLLFGIGLKLQLKSLARPEVWGGASVHMLVTTALFSLGIYGLAMLDVSIFSGLTLKTSALIAFALSFSSTVFAVKVLEERGEMASLHGRIAIGILIIQDIFAVLFLAFSEGKAPSAMALVFLPLLFLLRPIFMKILDRVGHRELLLLFALFMALGVGVGGFDYVSIKPDLGVLIVGILLASHPKASELSDTLLGFKDLFLVGFFLSIGFSGLPTWETLGISLALVPAVMFKTVLFFWILTKNHLRPRTSMLSALSLANFSEFGLLVGSIGVKFNWIGGEWLVVIAIALSVSYIIASPLNSHAHTLYAKFTHGLNRFKSPIIHKDDQPIDPGDASIIVFGMGRVGASAYDYMCEKHGDTVVGVDFDSQKVDRLKKSGRRVILGDATDRDFWDKAKLGGANIKLSMLALKSLEENKYAARQLSEYGYKGATAAIARFEEDEEELKEAGVHTVFNIFSEAGNGFARHTCKAFEKQG